jgi:dipeptidyl aminopeptidase/acylaminoacyl peptidase
MVAYDVKRADKAGIPAGSIRGFIGLSGPYALVPNDDELNRMFAAPYTAADWQPAQLVRPGSPPALLIHGEADDVVSVGHAKKMAAALDKAGVPVTLKLYPERGHSDTVAAFAKASPHKLPVVEQIRAFIDAQGP